MGDVVVRVSGLGKQYHLGVNRERYGTLRDKLGRVSLRGLLRWAGRAEAAPAFWALKNVSFEVGRGEVVGIIGRNGAGKSTLLKVLSRITEPTEGEVDIHGRVGSLLEVGTGFHPELTGRENVYLNGAILGMRRAEIVRQFDAIVGFAEVEKFIDTPVKHYSSGMYMRLAFAVAAHLDPVILIVDEVLAVGDAQFQKKCLGKMGEVAKDGRTVLFVSHNLGAVAELCSSAIVLTAGQVTFRGTPPDSITAYFEAGLGPAGLGTAELPADPTKPLQVTCVTVRTAAGKASDIFDIRDPIYVELRYIVRRPEAGMDVALVVSRNGTPLFCTIDTDHDQASRDRSPGQHTSVVEIPGSVLKAGAYTLTVSTGLTNRYLIELHPDLVRFTVAELSEDASGRGYAEQRPGHIIAPVRWTRLGT